MTRATSAEMIEAARRLRRTRTVRAIACKLGLGRATVQRITADVPGPVISYRDRFWTPELLAAVNKGIADGLSIPRLVFRIGVSRNALYRAEAVGLFDLGPARAVTKGSKPRQPVRKKQGEQAVPTWAAAAGLSADYRDFMHDFGPEYAARECRRLAAEARP